MCTNGTVNDYTYNDTITMTYIGTFLSVLVVCESILTIVTILRTPALQETQYLFIVSLSLMDILLVVACAAIPLMYLPSIKPHISGYIFNSISVGTSSASVTIAGVHMSVIAIDRYIRIAHPFYYITKMTKQRILKILLSVWIIWMLVACMPFLTFNDTHGMECYYQYHPQEFLALASIILFSVGIVCVCYGKIARLAISHKKAAIARRHQNGASKDSTDLRTNNITMKSIRFFVTMFGVYCVCAVVPFIVSGITILLDFPSLVSFIMWYLFPVHSFLNFIFFCVMDKRFKGALKTVLACPLLKGCCPFCGK